MKCKIFGKCGGCAYGHDNYPASLEGKQKYIESLFPEYKVEPILGSYNPYYYRNKVNDYFDFKGRNVLMGKYEGNTRNVLEVDECFIEDIGAQRINKTVKELAQSFRWSIYDEGTGRGLLRGSLVRVGKTSKEIMLIVVVADNIIPSSNNFVKAIREIHPEITSIVFNVHDRDSAMIIGDKNIVAFGKGYIKESLLGFDFRISPQSFFQVNSIMTDLLYKKTLEYADLTKEDIVVDAYCGIGTISLYIAQFCKEVYGVELNPEAIKDAIVNSKVNRVRNVHFTAMDAGEYLLGMAEEGIHVDAIIVDPARAGLDQNAINGLLKLKSEKVVYVSCNPEALVEDLKQLSQEYNIVKIQPVDMFPWTEHVETVVLLSKLDMD